MSNISVTGQESYFNEKATFFKGIKGDLEGNVVGNIRSEGISIFNNVVVDGITSELIVRGDARITGILTVGTGSITINGNTDIISGAISVTDNIGGFLTNPPGTLIFHCGSTAPPGYLKANGANISRSAYSALFAAVGTTFGAGDGSTTFTLPDMRGEFPRGWDDGRGVDSGRAFGNSQLDAFQNITGQVNGSYAAIVRSQPIGALSGSSGSSAPPAGSYPSYISGNINGDKLDFNAANSPGARTSTETRPRNIALLACIKY